MCLLLARRYPPYSKWLGSAFAAVPGVEPVAVALREAVETGDPARRQAALCAAYETVGCWHNGLGLAGPVEATRRPFFDRPYLVIDAARFAAALPPIGAVDQFVDSADVLVRPQPARTLMTAVSLSGGGGAEPGG